MVVKIYPIFAQSVEFQLLTMSEIYREHYCLYRDLPEDDITYYYLMHHLKFRKKIVLEKEYPENVHDLILTLDDLTQSHYLHDCVIYLAMFKALPELATFDPGIEEKIRTNMSAIFKCFNYNRLMFHINNGIEQSIKQIEMQLELFNRTGCLEIHKLIIKPGACSPEYIQSSLEIVKETLQTLKKLSSQDGQFGVKNNGIHDK